MCKGVITLLAFVGVKTRLISAQVDRPKFGIGSDVITTLIFRHVKKEIEQLIPM